MNGYALRLSHDRLDPGGSYPRPLPAVSRVLYVLDGTLSLAYGGTQTQIGANAAWYGARETTATAGPEGASVLRYELARPGASSAQFPGVASRSLLEHPVDLDPKAEYLIRCDRVDFAPGGEALPHRHQGGGIRCLITGTLELRVGAAPSRTIEARQAWFESGREPVYAAASADVPTSFVRCAILPRAIRGQSSILYVDPEDAKRGKPRQYTVLVDEPVELPD